MMNKEQVISFVMGIETGRIVHAEDGVSCWGISQANHPELTPEQIVDMADRPDAAAAILGGPQYWGAVHADQLPPWLWLSVFDAAVNQGAHAAMVLLQLALSIPADGLFGPGTLAAVGAATADRLLPEFAAQRVIAYTRDRTWGEDGLGWTRRVMKILVEAVK